MVIRVMFASHSVACRGFDSHRRQSEEGDAEERKAGGQQAARPRLGSLISVAYCGQSNLYNIRRQISERYHSLNTDS